MNKDEALKLWDELYLSEEKAYDYASHPMKREDYNNENSIYGWIVDEKQPNKTAGKNLINNEIPSSIVTKTIREGKTSFKIGKFLFEVRKSKVVYGEYDIYDITNLNNPLNMEPSDENQEEEFNLKRRKEILNNSSSINDEDIDEQLKLQRLQEKIEKEGYKPTDEESLKLNPKKEEVKHPVIEEKIIIEEKEKPVKEFVEPVKETVKPIEPIKPVEEKKEIVETVTKKEVVKEEQVKEVVQPKEEIKPVKVEPVKEKKEVKKDNSLTYELAPMFPVVNILE